jgi:hypothetical protein
MLKLPLVLPFSSEWHSMQELTKIGRILFSKKSFCSGVMAGVAAPFRATALESRATGAAQTKRRETAFSFIGDEY